MKRSIVRIGLGVVMGGLLWGGLPANPAVAGIVSFNFTGTVNSNISTPLMGSVTYDTSILDGNSSDNQYNGVITKLIVNAGIFSGVLDPLGSGNFIKIVDHTPVGLDSFTLRAPLAGAVGDNNFFRLTLKDPSGTAFLNHNLPTTAPSLSSFIQDRYKLVFEDAKGKIVIRGNIDSITPVPLPPAVILFGAGLIALVGLGAGSWRKRNNSSLSLA